MTKRKVQPTASAGLEPPQKRTRRLKVLSTSTRSEQQQAIYEANAANSPLLKLTPEIRNRIWHHMLGGRTIHVFSNSFLGYRHLSYTVCQLPHKDEEAARKIVRHNELSGGADDFDPYDKRHAVCDADWDPAAKYSRLSLNVLRSCRQVHEEGALLPFKLNDFSFDSFDDLTPFLQSLFQAQVRAIEVITLGCRFPNVTATLAKLVKTRLKGLRHLACFVELDNHDDVEPDLPFIRRRFSDMLEHFHGLARASATVTHFPLEPLSHRTIASNMDKLKGVAKGGWHPSRDTLPIHRDSWKTDLKGIATGKKKDPYEEARSHQSTPLTTLRDPDTFGPPPKHTGYGGSAGSGTDEASAHGGNGSLVPASSRRQQQGVEDEVPKPPPEPYRKDTTGLRTDHLPKPPVRRVEAGAASPARTSSPSLPPRQTPASPPPKAKNGTSKKPAAATNGDATTEIQYWEVADDLPFMPKKMWSGGVKYNAEFVAQGDGCDITVHAPGGFTSTNHWRIVREMVHEDELPSLTRVRTKDLLHAETGPGEGGWYVQIVSDARCSVTFQGIVKGFLKNSHVQLQKAFIEKLKEPAHLPREKRPELGRRRSTHH
ncbi:hypothetical protein B0A54_13634 [Friedmanniomyces endolithicus]|uniref:Uncharacterized protein n=1 Tax=Friedmanniomyces endolithicus TaxID=329885 RepID=A0A4U0UG81_9PEZI|nr:hypothetical protein B0A54_13634 [Friedmanniomyces endolithicus]